MAYLDTGELPWDMDFFEGQTEKVRVKKSLHVSSGRKVW